MAARTIYTRERIDKDTGELILDVNITAAKNKETFMFARTTDGISWIKEFRTLQDVLVLIYMMEFEELRSGVVIFTSTQIISCSDFFGVSVKTIRNSISSLIHAGFMKRISPHNFLINPCTFYRGGVASFIRKMHAWNAVVSDISSEIPKQE